MLERDEVGSFSCIAVLDPQLGPRTESPSKDREGPKGMQLHEGALSSRKLPSGPSPLHMPFPGTVLSLCVPPTTAISVL